MFPSAYEKHFAVENKKATSKSGSYSCLVAGTGIEPVFAP